MSKNNDNDDYINNLFKRFNDFTPLVNQNINRPTVKKTSLVLSNINLKRIERRNVLTLKKCDLCSLEISNRSCIKLFYERKIKYVCYECLSTLDENNK